VVESGPVHRAVGRDASIQRRHMSFSQPSGIRRSLKGIRASMMTTSRAPAMGNKYEPTDGLETGLISENTPSTPRGAVSEART
jgi:hypothetical protein